LVPLLSHVIFIYYLPTEYSYSIQTIPETDISVERINIAVKHVIPSFLFQYFVFDFHMPPVMLFDKIITLSVSIPLLLVDFIYCYLFVLSMLKELLEYCV
jgi:hypothetical protein